jgi:arylsulfatase A-like enzyme
MSPWNVRNTFLAWGAGVKKGVTVAVPAGAVDVTPTVLALLGIDGEAGLDGRVVAEALDGGPDPEQIPVETRIHTVAAGAYRAALQISTVAGRRYVDKSWRLT